jgi:hypothetical protein
VVPDAKRETAFRIIFKDQMLPIWLIFYGTSLNRVGCKE